MLEEELAAPAGFRTVIEETRFRAERIVREAAKNKTNLMPPIIESAKAYATQQEICDVLREVFGTYTDPAEF